jgi:hypothetical protein
MFTERDSSEFAESFSALLDAPLVSTEILELNTDRGAYFASCSTCHHLLLDPNTGLRFRVNPKERSPDHLFDSDLLPILNRRPDSLTMVFDQAFGRGREQSDLKSKVEKLQGMGLHGFAYRSHACFLFVTQNQETAHHALELLAGSGRLPRDRFVRGLRGWT